MRGHSKSIEQCLLHSTLLRSVGVALKLLSGSSFQDQVSYLSMIGHELEMVRHHCASEARSIKTRIPQGGKMGVTLIQTQDIHPGKEHLHQLERATCISKAHMLDFVVTFVLEN